MKKLRISYRLFTNKIDENDKCTILVQFCKYFTIILVEKK